MRKLNKRIFITGSLGQIGTSLTKVFNARYELYYRYFNESLF